MSDADVGVVFPAAEDGARSTSALGRGVVADALRGVDPPGAAAAERETNWRSGYLVHFRRLVEAGLGAREDAVRIASDGLASLHERLRFAQPAGGETPLSAFAGLRADGAYDTAVVRGQGEVETELSLPYHGERLRGDALLRRVEAWQRDGVLEPSAAEAVRDVVRHPEWLRLDGRTVVVLGAGAEMGPLQALLRWGADVVGIDLRRPEVWERVLDAGRRGAGTLRIPVAPGRADDAAIEQHAGLDLISEAPAAARWLEALDGRLALGNFVYADGATNLRVSAAVDALTVRLQEARDDVALAFLATPTDVFAVPADAVEHSVRAYDGRSRVGKLAGRPLRMLSGGRLLARAYAPGVAPGISDSLVPQQGPNYALAKRLQRWRATVAREAGATVSLNVAPPTRTRSVVKNRALAAAYAGAHRFGVEIFDPATSNTLMAALLVADLQRGGAPAHAHPWQDEAHAAVHGGLWRAAYAPRSALGLAALLGLGAART
jgi:hypothetical protein